MRGPVQTCRVYLWEDPCRLWRPGLWFLVLEAWGGNGAIGTPSFPSPKGAAELLWGPSIHSVLLSLEVGISWWLPWQQPQGDQLLHLPSPSPPLSLIFLSGSLPIVTSLRREAPIGGSPNACPPRNCLLCFFLLHPVSNPLLLPGYPDTCSDSLTTCGGCWAT